MRVWSILLGLAVFCLFLGASQAQEKEKAVTLKGDILCAKCEMKETKKCVTAIKVKEGDKEVVYYFKDKGTREDYHEAVCGGGTKEGTVTGTVKKVEGKNWITPKKVEYAKK